MNQTGIIFACLFAAWLMFVTSRGELPAYISVLTGSDAPKSDSGSGQSASNSGSGSGSSSTESDLKTAATVAEVAAMFA